jgi:phosphatidyl-N-methylethanolamine N-methyltransferase
VAETVNLDVLVWAAALLSLERICYVWLNRAPDAFRAVFTGQFVFTPEPTDAVRTLFVGFKVLQIGVVVWWCLAHGGGTLWPIDAPPWAVGLGSALIAMGQALNIGVFWRLGSTGVFYGNRFGHEIEWSRGFPFSVAAHPQYVGAVLTIWGVFLILRCPHADWLVLPALETAYYILGARLERAPRNELHPVRP